MAFHPRIPAPKPCPARNFDSPSRARFLRAAPPRCPPARLFPIASPLSARQTQTPAATPAKIQSAWRVQEFMVPMRDGIRLQTVVISRKDQTKPLPILLTRTPYGVPTQAGLR